LQVSLQVCPAQISAGRIVIFDVHLPQAGNAQFFAS
jgi:hypothetical protein